MASLGVFPGSEEKTLCRAAQSWGRQVTPGGEITLQWFTILCGKALRGIGTARTGFEAKLVIGE
jgi:hypothetical protein